MDIENRVFEEQKDGEDCMRKKACLYLMIFIVLLSGCNSEKEKNENQQPLNEKTVTVTEAADETYVYDEMIKPENVNCKSSQISVSAVICKNVLYYLSQTETINGEEGCYLLNTENNEKTWLSYSKFGRGIYCLNGKMLILTHDEETWSISEYNDGECTKLVELAEYDSLYQTGMPLNVCIKITDNYVYLLMKEAYDGKLPTEFSIHGKSLIRYSLTEGSCEEVCRAEEGQLFYADYEVNDNYLAITSDHVFYEGLSKIELYSTKDSSLITETVSAARHFVLDEDGNVYFGHTEVQDVNDIEEKAPAGLYTVGTDGKRKCIYKSDFYERYGEFNIYCNGEFFILDNFPFCESAENENRVIRLVDFSGKLINSIVLMDSEELEIESFNIAPLLSVDEGNIILLVEDETGYDVINVADFGENNEGWLTIYSEEKEENYAESTYAVHITPNTTDSKKENNDKGIWNYGVGLLGEVTDRDETYSYICDYYDYAGIFSIDNNAVGIVWSGEIKPDLVIEKNMTGDRDSVEMYECDYVIRTVNFKSQNGKNKKAKERFFMKPAFSLQKESISILISSYCNVSIETE